MNPTGESIGAGNNNQGSESLSFGDDLKQYCREVPDFPKTGILFKDITTLLREADAFREVIDAMAAPFKDSAIDNVAAIDARGLIFGGPIAYLLKAGFVPIRKRGKLPYKTAEVEYDLEYGTDAVAVHEDALTTAPRVLLVDDVIATGGTLEASANLVEKVGGTVVGIVALAELCFLNGRARLADYDVTSLVTF